VPKEENKQQTVNDSKKILNEQRNQANFANIAYILDRFKKDNLIKLSLSLTIVGLIIIVIAEISNLTGDIGIILLTTGSTFIVSAVMTLIVSLNEEEYRKLFDEALSKSPKEHEEIKLKEDQIITAINVVKNSKDESIDIINKIEKSLSTKEEFYSESEKDIKDLRINIRSLDNHFEEGKDQILEKINDGFRNVEGALRTKVDLAEEASACGIIRVFSCRHNDENYEKEMLRKLENADRNKEVLMMANSLRDFFGPARNKHYRVILRMLEKNVFFKILLLDPKSEAAIYRAFVEEGKKRQDYLESALFRDIKLIAQNLNRLIIDNEKARNNIEVRFSPFAPTTHLTITDKYAFVEQYHNGGNALIKAKLLEKGINCDCFGGFVPVIMYENASFFAKLMKSHFMNTWDSEQVANKNLIKDNYLKQISDFEENFRKH
jgi:hypothetical protein